MIENMDRLISIVVLIVIFLGSLVGFYKIDRMFKKDEESEEYYRDLL